MGDSSLPSLPFHTSKVTPQNAYFTNFREVIIIIQ